MLPYFHLSFFSLGPLKFHIWGLFVAAGFLIGLLIVRARAKKENIKIEALENLILWIVIFSLIFSRVFYVLFGGELGIFLARPWLILAIWQGGMMSTGGFFGAGLAILSFRARRGIFFKDKLKYADILAYAFPFGWLIGRIGCFLTHLHPGRLTNLFLGVNFPGGTRLDMAILEILALLPLAILFIIFSKKSRLTGFYAISLLLYYGVIRFFLDFFRAADLPFSDARYWSLTVAQWGSLLLIIISFILIYAKRISRAGGAA